MRHQGLTPEHRSIVCIHEAAHAVVYSLSGHNVYALAVAPVGSKSWSYKGRKGGVTSDVWGVCSSSDFIVGSLLKVRTDLSPVEKREYVENIFGRMGPDAVPAIRRETAEQICALLAGIAAEEILGVHTQGVLNHTEIEGHDIDQALDLASILPGFLASYLALYELTIKTLNEPSVWGAVMGLAYALEESGTLTEELEGQLPTPRPDWRKKVAKIAEKLPKK